MTLEHISASSVKSFNDCPAHWRHQYLLGQRDPSGPFAEIGTAAHAVVESYLKREIAHPTMSESLSKIPGPRERSMTVNYALSRAPKIPYLMGTEIPFLVEVLPGVRVKGFIDAAYWWPDGTLEIEDHKTNRKRETAEDWASKIQQRIYPLVARMLWPQAQRVRFTIGYVMLGGEVSWQTDPEWDKDTLESLAEAWRGMNSGEYPERMGAHYQYCPLRDGRCSEYSKSMREAETLLPSLRLETPAARYSRLQSLQKLVKLELEEAKAGLVELIEQKGPVVEAGVEWTMAEKSERTAPSPTRLWAAAMGPEGFDGDAMEILFGHMDEVFSVRLGGLDEMLKGNPTLRSRIQPLIGRDSEKTLKSSPVEKITKKTRKRAP